MMSSLSLTKSAKRLKKPIGDCVIDGFGWNALRAAKVHEPGEIAPERSRAFGNVPEVLPLSHEGSHICTVVANTSRSTECEQDVGLDILDLPPGKAAAHGMQVPKERPVKPWMPRQLAQAPFHQLAEPPDCGADVASTLKRQAFICLNAFKDVEE